MVKTQIQLAEMLQEIKDCKDQLHKVRLTEAYTKEFWEAQKEHWKVLDFHLKGFVSNKNTAKDIPVWYKPYRPRSKY